jgi:hypothetical protein
LHKPFHKISSADLGYSQLWPFDPKSRSSFWVGVWFYQETFMPYNNSEFSSAVQSAEKLSDWANGVYQAAGAARRGLKAA